jgi:hypothetical protein
MKNILESKKKLFLIFLYMKFTLGLIYLIKGFKSFYLSEIDEIFVADFLKSILSTL